ncbi:MAG: hypothetical protein JJE40_17015 [Vicinamibacteria bacterium]|nr:hypothetical protein [Vicinamibacteria bacterium]
MICRSHTGLKVAALAALVLFGPPRLVVAQTDPPPGPAPQAAEEAKKAEPSWKISGLIYADYYWFTADHRDAVEGQDGFWFRRIYLTYDHKFSDAFSTRVRLEMNSPGDFSSSQRMTPYVKDAWLKWTKGKHAVLFGMAPTPSFEFVESVWGYRSVEKTPLDLLRWDSSRDTGVLAQGALGGRTRYSVQLGNGSGVNGETDRTKAFRGAVRHEIVKGLTVEGYADVQDRPDVARWSTWQVFGGFVRPAGRLGAHFTQQRRRSAPGSDVTLDLVSVFGARRLRERLWVYGRADHNFDPVPDGEKIDYLPMSDKAGNTLWIGGVDVELDRHVFFQPHVEIVDYGTPVSGPGLATDVVVKATLFVTW